MAFMRRALKLAGMPIVQYTKRYDCDDAYMVF